MITSSPSFGACYLYERSVGARADHGCIGSVAEHGADRRDKNGFARAGLACDYIESIAKVERKMLDSGEIVDYNTVDHILY